jgi:hypothetical protein
MRVKFTRAHQGGSMSGIGNDVQVVDLPDETNGEPTPVPAGGTVVDPNTPVQDWTWQHGGSFGGGIAPQKGS